MSQRIVAFTGISGVGKTTFLKRLADFVAFQHITGGNLIAAALNADPDRRDTIRYADLDENQRLLIEGFALVRDQSTGLIIMDGHAVIDDGKSLTNISSDVFKLLEVVVMVHLEADPTRIAQYRLRDTSRSRPTYDIGTLKMHQMMSRKNARSIAESLQIDFKIVTHEDVSNLASRLKSER